MAQLTVELPENVYNHIRRAAEQSNRSIDQLVIDALTAAVPDQTIPTQQLRADLAQMALLNDAALWQAARATVPPALRERLEQLHHKQQREALTQSEQQEADALTQLYQDTLLVRAQAAVLLKQRQYDVSDLSQFTPLQ